MAKVQKTRRVANNTILANKQTDMTSHFELFLKNLIHNTSADGLVSRLNFYVTKNNNPNLTKDNEIFSLTIPIIPVAFNSKSARSLSEFVSYADSSEIISNLHKATDAETIRKREISYFNSIMAYIKGNLAFAYSKAKEQNDKNAMNILKSLDFMQDFDYELVDMLLSCPNIVIENNSNTGNSRKNIYKLVFNSGKVVEITKEQFMSINHYSGLIVHYHKTYFKFAKLSKALDDYETYDSTKNQGLNPLTHSVVANDSIRTSNPVTKVGAKNQHKNKPVPQKGEE